jgi:CRISPR-associated protein Cas1
MQIAIQVLLLREAGFAVNEGVLFYRKTKQRVRVVVDAALEREKERTIAAAWEVARGGVMPAPLEDSICLPDETAALAAQADESGQLLLFGEGAAEAPRDDLRPLHVNTQGLKIGKSGDVLQVREKEKVIRKTPNSARAPYPVRTAPTSPSPAAARTATPRPPDCALPIYSSTRRR